MTGANVPRLAAIDMYTRGAMRQRIILTEFVVGVIAMVGVRRLGIGRVGAGALLRAAPRRRHINSLADRPWDGNRSCESSRTRIDRGCVTLSGAACRAGSQGLDEAAIDGEVSAGDVASPVAS
jgi:hypothetical protein